MSASPVAILSTGLVTSVGLSAPSSCAAIRCKLTNPTDTHFIDSEGERMVAHQVALARPWRGHDKLVEMAVLAIQDVQREAPLADWENLPLLLCVAERERPGRTEGLDETLLPAIEARLGVRFSTQSAVVAHGRVGVAVALARARTMLYELGVPKVLIVAADSFLSWATLSHYDRAGRLLTTNNSNGFIAGEGAGALLVGGPTGHAELLCSGIGFGVEKAHIDSEEPLRADGLARAIKAALAEAGAEMHSMDFRIADLSGEQYYFKEAALALSRTLHRRKEEFDIWHPAECIGEAGALAGTAAIAFADAACRKSYAPGSRILLHSANDGGQRAAIVAHFKAS